MEKSWLSYKQVLWWDVAPADAMGKLKQARKKFTTGMQILNSSSGNTERIRDGLLLAQQQWMFFDGELRQSGDQRNHQQYAINVATTSERILEVMDGVTGLYQRLG